MLPKLKLNDVVVAEDLRVYYFVTYVLSHNIILIQIKQAI